MSLTTAEILGQYRRDLGDEGLDPDLIAALVKQAAHVLVRDDGVVVSRPAPECPCLRCHFATP